MPAKIVRTTLLLFTISIVLLHFLSAEFDPLAQGISYYALGKFGWLSTASLLFVGAASITAVLLLWPTCSTKGGRIGLSLLALWTVMLEAGAFFEMDAPGAVPTFSGRIHSVAGTSFLLLPPAALLIASSFSHLYPSGAQRARRWILAWCVVVTSGLLIIFNGFLVGLGVGGLVQRAYWLTLVLWLLSLAQTQPNDVLVAARPPVTVSNDEQCE